MVVAESLQTEQRALQTAKNRGALRGFSNLLAKEYGSWWNTRRWLVHLLLWPLLLNGLVLVVSFSLAKEPNFTAFEIAQMVTTLFFLSIGQVAAFGVVVATQSAITGEKQRGTAAWIMSKPVHRDVFVLAKLAAQAVSFLSLAVVLPSAIFFGQSRILWGLAPHPVLFVMSVLVVLLHVLFYLALTLMLGALFRGSGPVAGIGVGVLLGGLMAQERLSLLAPAMPWELPDIAALTAVGAPLARVGMPIAATALWTVLFVVVALWRFRRDEF
jgi:ABC-2 type transport system permease protein